LCKAHLSAVLVTLFNGNPYLFDEVADLGTFRITEKTAWCANQLAQLPEFVLAGNE
jgi:hypothetical protein